MNNEKEFKDLPEGWKWVRLGEVVILVKNISPKGSKPYIEIGDIDIHNKKYSIKEKESPNHCIKAKRGNIVISKVRPTRGAISLINEAFLYVSPAFSVLEANNSKFLFYSLSMRQFCNYLGTLETGTTYPSVNDEDVLSYKLTLPPLPEQQKIAEILETVDNAIEKTDKIIEKYKRIKQGLMQDLLTKGIDENGNIRSEKTHKFKDSPLGKIPEEWEVVRLGEVGNIVSGSTPSTYNDEYWNGEIVWITPNDLSNIENIFIEDSSRKITQKGLKSCSTKIISANSVVVSSRAPIGYVKVSKVPFATNQGCKSIEYNGKFSPIFLAFLLSNKVQDMINLGSGTTFQEISKSNLANIPIPLPPLHEQQRIASILSQIDQTIEKEQQYKEKLKRIKQGLMEDLLTGKVRVNTLIKE
jgi:type I restriction enzyme S subunit